MNNYTVPEDRLWFRFWPANVPRHLDYPQMPLYQLVSEAAGKWPQRVAFSFQDRSLSYRELDDLTSRLAGGLRSLGIEQGERVMLLLPNSLEFVISYYGILKAGATVTPANPLYQHAELKHQVEDTGAMAVIATSRQYSLLEKIRAEGTLRHIILADVDTADGAVALGELLKDTATVPPPDVDPGEDVAVIPYTGGTTGLSRGVLITHRNILANAMQNATWFNWTHRDVVMGLLPMYHSWGGCTCINSPIYSGARVIIMPRFDAEEVLKTIAEQKVTVLYGAASMFTTLINSPHIGKYDVSSLRYVKAGAMPIPSEIRDKWEQLTGVRMILGYGLSEASPETHNSPLERVKPGTIGIPVIDTDARIVDQDNGDVELAPGQTGELVIRGPQVMKGYLNQPEETAATLRNGWLHTGDLAMMDEEGYFRILDRKKETIKYKGYTIAPAEVEAIMYEHPSVKECAVIGKPDAATGEIPKAFVVLKPGCTARPDELIQFCAERIAPYKRIREVAFVDEIPKTPVGKLLRRILRERERGSQK